MYFKEFCSKLGLWSKHLVYKLLVFTLSHFPFQLESGCQLTPWDREIFWDQLEFSDVLSARHGLLVCSFDTVLEVL